MYALSISFGPCLILARWLRGVMYLQVPWIWCINMDDSCPQETTVSNSTYRIHFLIVPDSVTGKHLQRASVVT